MTHNPKELRASYEKTLLYIFRGDRHEHEFNPDDIEPIAGTVGSLPRWVDGAYELEGVSMAFQSSQELHTGKGEKLYKHFVISLAPNEHLSSQEWEKVCQEYMSKLGYDKCHWIACKHSDKIEHVHILASRVKLELGGPLVSTYKDYEKGWPIMRHFEQAYNLTKVDNPYEGFGHNYTKPQIKAAGGRIQAQKSDSAHSIRVAIKQLYAQHGTPRSMTQFVGMLASKDIAVKATLNNEGEIRGLSYSNKEGLWLSGTRIKKTQLTFQALLKNGVSYKPSRDDFALGLSQDTPLYAQFSVKVSKKEVECIKRVNAPLFVRKRNNSAWADFTLMTSRRQKEQAIAVANMLLLMKMIFGLDDESIEFRAYLDNLSLLTYQQNLLHYSSHQHVYKSNHNFDAMKQEVDEQTMSWRNRGFNDEDGANHCSNSTSYQQWMRRYSF
ncbi:relaxase/mobilization nuclease domain-containing protein [Vibrio crassostreae]|uniref:relaxase/mobilization nuclease domain-containing protein n=1 Tax=Vibrio crassostreae TaxID=246167 RepID=UPI000F95D6CA|nr:relaxase/mobilization nuclease domain-containing protein [Vibrio crassostreae]RPF03755.1 relaxase/mobilization nuclease-like protein [Vibrio crassostreae]